MNRHRTAAVVTASLVCLAGCAGPTATVTFGGKSVPLAVAFGAPPPTVLRMALPPGGVGGFPLVPVADGVGVLPVASVNGPDSVISSYPGATADAGFGPPQAAALACPGLPAHSSSREAAPSIATGLPPVGKFPILFSGEYTQAGKTSYFSGRGSQQVGSESTSQAGSTSFQVTAVMLGSATTYSYLVDPPTQSVEQSVNDGMIALSSVTGAGGLGYQASFKPSAPLELLTQPAFDAETWSGADTDASSGTAAQVSGVVQGEKLANACGAGIDTWEANDTIKTTSPNEAITTTLQIYFATQYGGLPVLEVESYSGTAGSTQVSGSLTWVYLEDPGARR